MCIVIHFYDESITFFRVDKDGDSLVTVEELSDFIQERTNEHISQALNENYGLFMTIDKDPKNGNVLVFFLYLALTFFVSVALC